jgi:hypothetical protein
MPHRNHANSDDPHNKPHCLTYSSLAFMATHHLAWKISSVVTAPILNSQDWQSWFCQSFGITPPALDPYTGQLCSCLRQCLDADHLHTCSHHSGNWQAGHELLLTAVADIAHDAGFRTNRGSRVPLSSGQRCGDLEIKGLSVAGTSDLIIDVALFHDFHGSVAQIPNSPDLLYVTCYWPGNEAHCTLAMLQG